MVISELLNTLIKSYVRVWYNLKLKIFGQINGDVIKCIIRNYVRLSK